MRRADGGLPWPSFPGFPCRRAGECAVPRGTAAAISAGFSVPHRRGMTQQPGGLPGLSLPDQSSACSPGTAASLFSGLSVQPPCGRMRRAAGDCRGPLFRAFRAAARENVPCCGGLPRPSLPGFLCRRAGECAVPRGDCRGHLCRAFCAALPGNDAAPRVICRVVRTRGAHFRSILSLAFSLFCLSVTTFSACFPPLPSLTSRGGCGIKNC